MPLDNEGGTVEADSGILSLADGGTNTGGSYNAGTGGTIDLANGGATAVFTGTYTGSGGGTINIGTAAIAVGVGGVVFDFPAGLFQWSTGGINFDGHVLTNIGTITLDNSQAVTIFANGGFPGGVGGGNRGDLLSTRGRITK